MTKGRFAMVVVGLVLRASAREATALEITACDTLVPAGEIGELRNDLICTHTAGLASMLAWRGRLEAARPRAGLPRCQKLAMMGSTTSRLVGASSSSRLVAKGWSPPGTAMPTRCLNQRQRVPYSRSRSRPPTGTALRRPTPRRSWPASIRAIRDLASAAEGRGLSPRSALRSARVGRRHQRRGRRRQAFLHCG